MKESDFNLQHPHEKLGAEASTSSSSAIKSQTGGPTGTTGQPGQSKQQATVPVKDHVQNPKMESDQEIEYTFDFFNHVCMCTHT